MSRSKTTVVQCSDFPQQPRNQSIEHLELANRALRWLAARSTPRGICGSTEIEIAQGYVCDAVAIGGFQNRFLRRYLKLSGLTRKHCNFRTHRQPEVDGDTDNEFGCVFEVKVSRADFLGTFKKAEGKHVNRHTPVSSMHWVVTPKGLIKPHELPDFWGLLEAAGQGLREVQPPRVFVVGQANIHAIAYSILTQGRRRPGHWLHIPVCPACSQPYAKEKESVPHDSGVGSPAIAGRPGADDGCDGLDAGG